MAETEPITLEELDAQVSALIKRGLESKLKVIDILACIESNKLALTIYLFQAATADGVL